MKLSFDYQLFGLEPRDLLVYEAMLTNPDASSIRTIAANVNMNRGTTFDIIKKLAKLGLIAGYYKNSRKFYVAQPPDSLKRYAELRQGAITDELQKVSRYADQLSDLKVEEAVQQFGKHYEGEEEIAVLLHDVLDTVEILEDKTYRVISSAEVRNNLYNNFKNFTRQRIKRGIYVQAIAVGGMSELAELAERKQLSTEKIPASYTIIYGDKVAHITLTNLGSIQGAVIENTGIAELQRLLFDALWEKL